MPSKYNPKPRIQGGDLVKIDMGVQLDGFIAQAGHSMIVPLVEGSNTTGVEDGIKFKSNSFFNTRSLMVLCRINCYIELIIIWN